MSSRKPKSVVIRHRDEDSDSDGEETVAMNGPQIHKEKEITTKTKRSRIKLKSQFVNDEEVSVDGTNLPVWTARKLIVSNDKNEEDDDVDDNEILTLTRKISDKQKSKQKNTKKGLRIPLFEGLEDDNERFGTAKIEELKDDGSEQSQEVEMIEEEIEDEPIIIAPPDEDEDQGEGFKEEDFISLDQISGNNKKSVMFDNNEYISVVSPEEVSADEEDQEMNEQAYEALDDGRLPLSSREAELQKKMLDMEIKEAMYDVEISEDEEMTDWTASKIKQGAFDVNSSTRSRQQQQHGQWKPPKLNLISNESFGSQKAQVEGMIEVLDNERDDLSVGLRQLALKNQRFDEQLAELKDKLERIGMSV